MMNLAAIRRIEVEGPGGLERKVWISEQLDYEPAHFLRRRLVRRKYVSRLHPQESPVIIGEFAPRNAVMNCATAIIDRRQLILGIPFVSAKGELVASLINCPKLRCQMSKDEVRRGSVTIFGTFQIRAEGLTKTNLWTSVFCILGVKELLNSLHYGLSLSVLAFLRRALYNVLCSPRVMVWFYSKQTFHSA